MSIRSIGVDRQVLLKPVSDWYKQCTEYTVQDLYSANIY
jgi:hypothetical protein